MPSDLGAHFGRTLISVKQKQRKKASAFNRPAFKGLPNIRGLDRLWYDDDRPSEGTPSGHIQTRSGGMLYGGRVDGDLLIPLEIKINKQTRPGQGGSQASPTQAASFASRSPPALIGARIQKLAFLFLFRSFLFFYYEDEIDFFL